MLARLSIVAALLSVAQALPAPQATTAVESATSAASSIASSFSSVSEAASSSMASAVSTSASAASPSASASSYLTGLVEAITARNAPALANVISSNPSIANALGGLLSSGQNYTLIAPSDPGLNAALATVDATNTTLITQLLTYHLIPGYYPAAELPVNETEIVNTALNENLVFFRDQYLTTRIQGGQNVTILANSTYQNVLIKLADNALRLPSNISSTWMVTQPNSQLLTTLATVLPNFVTTLDTTPMLTVFAPSNQAIANVQSAVTSLAANPSQLQTVLEGHIVNGTVIYSNSGNPNVAQGGSVQSAAGTTLQFSVNATGAYVSSQGTTARIIQSDIITSNGVGQPGVVHLIDAVLVPPSNQTTAASTQTGSASAAPASSSSAPSAVSSAGSASVSAASASASA